MTAGFIASTIPAKIVRASGTTLFHIAMRETGDPLQWVALAELNGLTHDPGRATRTLVFPQAHPTWRVF
jgi:hypothetical protein